MSDDTSLGPRLKAARQQKNLTQADLAQQAGLNQDAERLVGEAA